MSGLLVGMPATFSPCLGDKELIQKRNSAVSTNRKLLWHALCFVPLSACLITDPLPTILENQAPMINPTSYPPDEPIVWKDTSVNVWVMAVDPDGDEINFFFSLSEDGSLGTAVQVSTNPEGWQVTLPYDLDLDGQVLTCTVFDDQVVPAWSEVSWPLEVL